MNAELLEPRLMGSGPLLIAGASERYTPQTAARIPQLWQQFAPQIGHIPGQVGWTTYGVCLNGDDHGFEYVAGVEVEHLDDVPAGLRGLTVPAHTYAVFTHRGHVSALRSTMDAIFATWLPTSNYRYAGAPILERYGEAFDPKTGGGEIEVWLPVDARD